MRLRWIVGLGCDTLCSVPARAAIFDISITLYMNSHTGRGLEPLLYIHTSTITRRPVSLTKETVLAVLLGDQAPNYSKLSPSIGDDGHLGRHSSCEGDSGSRSRFRSRAPWPR